MKTKSLRDMLRMPIHEDVQVSTNPPVNAFRVPGGWVYTEVNGQTGVARTSVFVPEPNKLLIGARYTHFIDEVCLSYRHDFGLLSEDEKNDLRGQAKAWHHAITKNS